MLLLNILAYGQFFLTVQIPTVFSSYITADLGVSAMTVSLCGTIILGVFALTGGFGARLVAKFGLKLSICIAIIVNIIGALLILVIGHSFPGYAVCCAIEGLSGGLICGPITTINTYWFPIRERGIASGILLGILGVAFSIDTFFAPKIMASGVAWQTGASLLAAVGAYLVTMSLQSKIDEKDIWKLLVKRSYPRVYRVPPKHIRNIWKGFNLRPAGPEEKH